MDLFGLLWIGWGLAFALIEGVALALDKRHLGGGFTLSEHLRLWLRTDTRLGRTGWMVISGVFFAWFTIHIAHSGLVYP
jgi:hypothetical protein